MCCPRRGRNRRRAGIITALVPALCCILLVTSCATGAGQADSRTSGHDSGDNAAAPATTPVAPDIAPVNGPGIAPVLTSPRADQSPAAAGGLAGRIICIDPGHAAATDPGTEPIGPGASEMKVKDPGGTSGVASGVREPVVTLAISLQLRDMLEAEGASVVMTRSGPDFIGGNRDRAMIANQAGADLFIRVHADGSSDPSRSGVSTLYPAPIPGWTDDIHVASRAAATAVQSAMAAGIGAPDLGTVARSDISGFNWADVPAILVEVGFMSNPREDLLLNDPAYQQQVAASLLDGIRAYLG